MWKTDYLGIHDKKYKQLKNEGQHGWSSPEDIDEMTEFVIKSIPPDSSFSSILELGCGDGNLSIELAKKGFNVYGIDISPTAINWAKEKAVENNVKADFRIGNVTDLPYENDFFDIVVDGHCLHCIIDDDRKLFLENAMRVLKKGGMLVVMTMAGEISEKMKDQFDPVPKYLSINGLAGRYIGDVEDIVEEIESCGFHILYKEVTTPKNEEDQGMLLLLGEKP